MPKIRVLGDQTINRIAAGEVIQRPASVVKELVENALDAGARRVDVDLRHAGKSLVRVEDDGEGMDEEDLLLAVERHATSKVKDGDEIFGGSTLGFRGEALPSIAAVSNLCLETSCREDGAGHRLISQGGVIREVAPCVRRRGTAVEIRQLFYNTPARRKFLKGDAVEAAHGREVMSGFLLTRPEVAFRYRLDGRDVLQSPGDGQVASALARVFGPEDAARMVPLERRQHPSLPFSLSGSVSTGLAARSSASAIVLAINGRIFRSPQMNRVIQRVYAPWLAGDRWPLAVLFIEADPRTVDVNVHPAKLEVRFAFFDKVAQFVTEALSDVVRKAAPALAPSQAPSSAPSFSFPSPSPSPSPSCPPPTQPPLFDPAAYPRPAFAPQLARDTTSAPPSPSVPTPVDVGSRSSSSSPPPSFFTSPPTPLRLLGQVFDTYLLAASRDVLLLVDQHAAHERILYEKVLDGSWGGDDAVQRLLVPQRVPLGPDELALLEEHLDDVQAAGLLIDFEPEAAVVSGVPPLFAGQSAKDVVLELLQSFTELWRTGPVADRREALAATVACKAAVKAGDLLTQGEMEALLRDLRLCRQPGRCPHGRPTVIEVTPSHLERSFGRRE